MLEPAVDQLITHPQPGAQWRIPLLIAVIAMSRGLFQLLQTRSINQVGNGVVGDMQVRLFGKLVRSDLARLRGAHSGSYVSSMLYDATLIREAATSGVVNYTREFLIVVGQLAVMFYLDPILATGVLVIAPVASLFIRRFSKKTTKAAKGAMGETSNLSTAIMGSLDGVKIVKMENREAYEEGRVAAVITAPKASVAGAAMALALEPLIRKRWRRATTAATRPSS